LVEKYFLELQRWEKSKWRLYSEESDGNGCGYKFQDVKTLRFGFTVTLLNLVRPTLQEGAGAQALEMPMTSISSQLLVAQNIKTLYGEHDNFSDIKIETKDGIVMNAHKFILAGNKLRLLKIIMAIKFSRL